MLTTQVVDTTNKTQVDQFIQLQFRLYGNCPQWVPPIIDDVRTMLNRQKHPFYEHSDGEFFLAKRDDRVVGRLGVVENKPFNKAQGKKHAFFTLFECENDPEAAAALFERAFEWAKRRGLDTIVGPKGLGPFDGYGILTMGYEHRQMMTMMGYNYPYYVDLVEKLGFTKEVDFLSCYLPGDKLYLSEKVHEVARRVREKGIFKVISMRSKKDLKSWANRIGQLYNSVFVNNWEYYPLSEREIKQVLKDLLLIADPPLIKLITYKDNLIGFLFGFPDLSEALQRAKGKITPWSIVDLMLEIRRSKIITFNGTGILPEYQGRGGNALLYDEMEKTVHNSGRKFEAVDMPQVAETTQQMRRDLKNLGGIEYKNHRVYHRPI